jgi:eukaryotic-like serine/threonine-protein kinase
MAGRGTDAPTWDATTLNNAISVRSNSLRPPPQPVTFDERYRFEAKLGEGGMGIVSLCLDRAIGRSVAMKVVRDTDSAGEHGVSRFLREARVQGQLEHPSIVPVYDLGIDPRGHAFFTMKRVRGTTLFDVIGDLREGREDSRWSRRRLLSAFGNVCLAVDFAHQHGVIHRDLKPANVMLGDFGEVYVLDWGVARVAMDVPVSDRLDVEATDAIAASAVLGTPGYMAPEQIKADNAVMGPWTDVYALGCVLYELLTLEALIEPGVAADMLSQTLKGVDARASERAPDANVPPELEALIVKATALDPRERMQSARELSDALEAFLDGERDIELRRELASQHAERASIAASRARTEDNPSFEERRNALREVSRALALDPDNADALDILVKLMAQPPRRLPEEVDAAMASNQRHRLRRVSRIGSAAYSCVLLYLPFLLWSGVRNWPSILLLYVCALAAAGSSFVASIRKQPRELEVFGALILSNIAFAATAPLFGPLVLMPTLITVNTMGYALNLTRRQRPFAIALGCVASFVPLLLLLLNLLPGTYVFEADRMIITAGALHLPRIPTLVMLFSLGLGATIIGSITVARMRDALDDAERQIYLYAWHLREFLPEAARASTDPTGARRALAMSARSRMSRA